MIAALIFVISVAAGIQLAVFSWRAAMISFAGQQVSTPLAISMTAKGFREITAVQALCPDLTPSRSKQLRPVQAYFRSLELLNSLSKAIPACGAWAQQEMAICARYATAVMEQRLQSNQACFAAVRSY
jgi:hypothetical protein